MKKYIQLFTMLLTLIAFTCSPLMAYGLFDPLKREATVIHIEKIDEGNGLVFQKNLDSGSTEIPLPLKIEFERLRQEFSNYAQSAKSQGTFLTPEDIAQFFTDQGYDIAVIDSKDSSYLNPSDYKTDSNIVVPYAGILTYAIGAGVTLGVLTLAGTIIGAALMIAGMGGGAFFTISATENLNTYNRLGGKEQDNLMDSIRSALKSWQEQIGLSEEQFADIYMDEALLSSSP